MPSSSNQYTKIECGWKKVRAAAGWPSCTFLGWRYASRAHTHTATHDGDHSPETSRQRPSRDGNAQMLQGQAPSGPLVGRPAMRLRRDRGRSGGLLSLFLSPIGWNDDHQPSRSGEKRCGVCMRSGEKPAPTFTGIDKCRDTTIARQSCFSPDARDASSAAFCYHMHPQHIFHSPYSAHHGFWKLNLPLLLLHESGTPRVLATG